MGLYIAANSLGNNVTSGPQDVNMYITTGSTIQFPRIYPREYKVLESKR